MNGDIKYQQTRINISFFYAEFDFLSWGNISSRSLYKIEKGLLKCLHVISSHSDEKHQILKIIEIEDN